MTKDLLQKLDSEDILISDIRPRGVPIGKTSIKTESFVEVLNKISYNVLPSIIWTYNKETKGD